MFRKNSLDLFLEAETPSFRMGVNDFPSPSPPPEVQKSDLPIKALKLGLRLPSHLKKISDQQRQKTDYHKRCKHPIKILGSKQPIRIAIIRAQRLLKEGNSDKACQIVEEFLNRGSEHADVFYLAGESRRQMGDLDQAQNYLLQAISMKLHSPQSYKSLALVYQDKGNHQQAVGLFRHYLQVTDSVSAHYDIARSLMALKDYSEAVHHFSMNIEMSPYKVDPAVFVLRAEAYEKMGLEQEARADYRQVMIVDPQFCVPYTRLADYLESSGDEKQAQAIRMFLSKLFCQLSLIQNRNKAFI